MAAQAGVAEVHDLHAWKVISGFPALSAHVLVGERDDCHEIGYVLKRLARVPSSSTASTTANTPRSGSDGVRHRRPVASGSPP